MSSLIADIQRSLRDAVSGDKYRFRENQWDLDLTYITPRIIAMGIPGDGMSSNWRNNIKDVSNFFYQKHHGHFLIINLSGESYNYHLFEDRVVDFPFPDHHPPPLEVYLQTLKKMREWLVADPANVVAVHCLAGRSRTGTVIAGYLLYSSFSENALKAITFFNSKRSLEARDVCLPSQIRYVGYMDSLLQDHERRALKEPQTRVLRAVTISPPFRLEGSVKEGRAFWKPYLQLKRQSLPQETIFRKTYPTVYMSDTNSVRLEVPNLSLTGDVLLKLGHVATNPISYGRVCMKIQKVAEAATSLDSDLIVDVARISFHTSFMEASAETSFYSFEIDAHKAGPIGAGSKYIPFDLTVTLEFEPAPGASSSSRKAIPKCDAPPVNPAALALAAAHNIVTGPITTSTPSLSPRTSSNPASPRKGISPRSASPTPSDTAHHNFLAPSPATRQRSGSVNGTSGTSSRPYDDGNVGVGSKVNPLPGFGKGAGGLSPVVSPRGGTSPRGGSANLNHGLPSSLTPSRNATSSSNHATPSATPTTGATPSVTPSTASPATARANTPGRPRNKSDPTGSPSTGSSTWNGPSAAYARSPVANKPGQTTLGSGQVVYSHDAFFSGANGSANSAVSSTPSNSSRSSSYTYQHSSYSESSSASSYSYEPNRTGSTNLDTSGAPIRNVYLAQGSQTTQQTHQVAVGPTIGPNGVPIYDHSSVPPNSGVAPHPTASAPHPTASAPNMYYPHTSSMPTVVAPPASSYTPPTGYPPGYVPPASPRRRPNSMHVPGSYPATANPYDPRNQSNPYAYASNPYASSSPSPPVNPYAPTSSYSSSSSSYSTDSAPPQGWPPGYQPSSSTVGSSNGSSTPNSAYPLPVFVPHQ